MYYLFSHSLFVDERVDGGIGGISRMTKSNITVSDPKNNGTEYGKSGAGYNITGKNG